MLDDIMYCPEKNCPKPILVKMNSTIIRLQTVKPAKCRWVSQQICQSCDKPSAKALHVSCPRMLSQPLETVNHNQKHSGQMGAAHSHEPWRQFVQFQSFHLCCNHFQQFFKSTKTQPTGQQRYHESNFGAPLPKSIPKQKRKQRSDKDAAPWGGSKMFGLFAWSVVWKNTESKGGELKKSNWIDEWKIWCTWYSKQLFFYWLFQLDDSKSLHKEWLFHQTSI